MDSLFFSKWYRDCYHIYMQKHERRPLSHIICKKWTGFFFSFFDFRARCMCFTPWWKRSRLPSFCRTLLPTRSKATRKNTSFNLLLWGAGSCSRDTSLFVYELQRFDWGQNCFQVHVLLERSLSCSLSYWRLHFLANY